jgi:hypothetical protein
MQAEVLLKRGCDRCRVSLEVEASFSTLFIGLDLVDYRVASEAENRQIL